MKLLQGINTRVFTRNWPRRSHMIKPELNRAEMYNLPNSLFTGIPGYGQSTSLTMLPSVLTPFILSSFQLFCSETIYEAATMCKRLVRALSMDRWLSGSWVWSVEHSHYRNGVYGPEGGTNVAKNTGMCKMAIVIHSSKKRYTRATGINSKLIKEASWCVVVFTLCFSFSFKNLKIL